MRYEAYTYDPALDEWELAGSVILPHDAPEHEVEHALVAIGLYCPRGADELEWGAKNATIFDASGWPMVRLIAREPAKKHRRKRARRTK